LPAMMASSSCRSGSHGPRSHRSTAPAPPETPPSPPRPRPPPAVHHTRHGTSRHTPNSRSRRDSVIARRHLQRRSSFPVVRSERSWVRPLGSAYLWPPRSQSLDRIRARRPPAGAELKLGRTFAVRVADLPTLCYTFRDAALEQEREKCVILLSLYCGVPVHL
jgi:hypothetical protein